MTTSPRLGTSGPAPRVLVLGRSPAVLQKVMQELTALGLVVQGSTQPERAADQFDAREFDLVAIGGGVTEPVRARLKQAFAGRSPRVRLLDAYAPGPSDRSSRRCKARARPPCCFTAIPARSLRGSGTAFG